MKKLIALIKGKGKSKKQIADELKKTLKRKGFVNDDGVLKVKQNDHKDEERK